MQLVLGEMVPAPTGRLKVHRGQLGGGPAREGIPGLAQGQGDLGAEGGFLVPLASLWSA